MSTRPYSGMLGKLIDSSRTSRENTKLSPVATRLTGRNL
jgi:hypothetical protein